MPPGTGLEPLEGLGIQPANQDIRHGEPSTVRPSDRYQNDIVQRGDGQEQIRVRSARPEGRPAGGGVNHDAGGAPAVAYSNGTIT